MEPFPPNFAPIDWSAPLDAEARIRTVPARTTVRGMFFRSLLKDLQHPELPPASQFVAFRSYPASEYMRLSVIVCRHLHPRVPLRQALRQLGQTVYPTLLDSMIGRAAFGAIGRNPETLMRLVPKGYTIATDSLDGQVKTLAVTSHTAHLRFVNFPGFFDCYHVGVVEGALLSCERRCEVRVLPESAFVGELFVVWE